jgi:hypothetical protein
MSHVNAYLDLAKHPVVSMVKAVDQDVERGEDILMLGYALVLMAPIFAPIAPPHILLPLMAIAFVTSVCMARRNFHGIQKKLSAAMTVTQKHDLSALRPITDVFAEHPKHTLADGFNPLKNLLRTLKSVLGALLINPFWMPIFYVLGLQFLEEKQLQLLNKAVINVEKRIAHLCPKESIDETHSY